MSDQKHDKDPHATDQQSDVMDEVLTEIDLDDLDMPLDEPETPETGNAEPDLDDLLSQTFEERRGVPAQADVFDELDGLTLDDFIDDSEEQDSREVVPEAPDSPSEQAVPNSAAETAQESLPDQATDDGVTPTDTHSEDTANAGTALADETPATELLPDSIEISDSVEAVELDTDKDIAAQQTSLADEEDHEDALSKLFGAHPDDQSSGQPEKPQDDASVPPAEFTEQVIITAGASKTMAHNSDTAGKDIDQLPDPDRTPVKEIPTPATDLPETALPKKEPTMSDKTRSAETAAKTSKPAGMNLNMANSIPMSLGLVAVLVAAVAVWLGLDASHQADMLKTEPQKIQQQIQQLEEQLQQQNMAMEQQVETLQLQLNDLTKVVANKARENWQASNENSTAAPSGAAEVVPQSETLAVPVQAASKRMAGPDTAADAGHGWFVNLLSVEAQNAAVAEIGQLRAKESEALRLQVVTLKQQIDELTSVIANNAAGERQKPDDTAVLSVKGEVSTMPEAVQPASSGPDTGTETTTPSDSKEPSADKSAIDQQKSVTARQAAPVKVAANKFRSPYEVAPNSAKGWAVNLTSYDTEQAADAEVRRLRAKDVRAEFVRVIIKGTVWFRVRISGFANEHEAVAYEKYVSEFHAIDAWHHKL